MRRFLQHLWKPGISLLILAIVWLRIDIEGFSQSIRNLRWAPLFFALGIFAFAQLILSLRYMYAMKVLNRKCSLLFSIRIHFLGMWFNQILPGGVGGDIIKVAAVKGRVGLSRAIRGTLLNRISGLSFLMLSILLLLPAYHILLRNQAITFTLAMLALGFFLGLFAILRFNKLRAVRKISPKPWRHLTLLLNDIMRFKQRKFLVQQLWTSAVVYAISIITYYSIGRSLGIELPAWVYILFVPLIFLISLLPVSFGGWGVREVGSIGLFGLVGLPAEQAFAMSVVFGLMVICASLPGGLLLLLPRTQRSH